jgi:very-short-patch-repair endonuclease
MAAVRPFRRPGSADEVIASIAAGQHGRITSEQMLAAGLRTGEIKHRVATKRLHREHRGVYCVGFSDTSQIGLFMAAVLACGPRAVLSHRCAAILLGLLRGVAPRLIDVTVGGRSCRGRDGIRVHLPHHLTRSEVTLVDGIPCTIAARTLVDLAAEATEHEREEAFDQARRLRLLPPRELEHQLALRRPGARAIRDLHQGPDLRFRFERDFRRFLRAEGYPAARFNERIATPLGNPMVDVVWFEHCFALELDSRAHHADRRAFETDRERDIALELAGIAVRRVTWRMFTERREVVRALLDQGLR